MAGKMMVAVVAFILGCVFLSADILAEDYEARLRDVKYKKATEEMNYNKELAEINKKGNDDLEAIKADFHAKRNARLTKLKEDQAALKDAYEAKMAPLREEEKKLLEALAPAGANFVKPKERKK
jgi:hypothetical protein